MVMPCMDMRFHLVNLLSFTYTFCNCHRNCTTFPQHSSIWASQQIHTSYHCILTGSIQDCDYHQNWKLNELLSTHPNQALVDSICVSLKNSVWPFVNIDPSAPETFNGSQCVLNAEATQFTLDQLNMDIELNCYSVALGPDLFPRNF